MSRSQPNVIVIMTDQQKATSLGMYANPDVSTPGLDALAASGIRFGSAFTVAPLCVPSRASMWTGAYPHNHGVRTNELRLSAERDTYLQAFQGAGYRTGIIGKNHCFDDLTCQRLDTHTEYLHRGVVDQSPDPRDEAFRNWISDHNEFTELFGSAVTPLPADHCPPARIAEQAADFIAVDDDRPFLLWVSFPEPHEPYYAPEPYYSMYDPAEIQLPTVGDEDPLAGKPERQRLYRWLAGLDTLAEDDLRRAVATYYASVSFVDSQVDRIMAALDTAQLRDDTIVVYLSDHGDFAGEHGLVVKCNAFYDCLTRIPLIMSWPGHIPTGTVSHCLVSNIDVMPTVARLTDVPEPAGSRGQLLPGLGSDAEPRHEVFAEYGAGGEPITRQRLYAAGLADRPTWRQYLRAREYEGRAKMIRTLEWKYVFDPIAPDAEELYNIQTDPGELVNLAGSAAHSDVITNLRTRILAWSTTTEDPNPIPRYFDPVALANTSEPH